MSLVPVLGGLPNEIWLAVLEFCDFISWVKLRATCKGLCNVSCGAKKSYPHVFMISDQDQDGFRITASRQKLISYIFKRLKQSSYGQKFKIISVRMGELYDACTGAVELKLHNSWLDQYNSEEYVAKQLLPLLKIPESNPAGIKIMSKYKMYIFYDMNSRKSVVVPRGRRKKYRHIRPLCKPTNIDDPAPIKPKFSEHIPIPCQHFAPYELY